MELNKENIQAQIYDAKMKLQKLYTEMHAGLKVNVSQFKSLRKEIARLLTKQNEK